MKAEGGEVKCGMRKRELAPAEKGDSPGAGQSPPVLFSVMPVDYGRCWRSCLSDWSLRKDARFPCGAPSHSRPERVGGARYPVVKTDENQRPGRGGGLGC